MVGLRLKAWLMVIFSPLSMAGTYIFSTKFIGRRSTAWERFVNCIFYSNIFFKKHFWGFLKMIHDYFKSQSTTPPVTSILNKASGMRLFQPRFIS